MQKCIKKDKNALKKRQKKEHKGKKKA